jgi:predicted O-methyltransferase YrrM
MRNCREGIMDVHPKYPRWLPAPLRKGWALSRRINSLYGEMIDPDLAERLNGVEGHTTPRQCAVLFYFAYTLKGGRIVEIGSFKGKSTVWIAEALRRRGAGERVAAVDPHENTGKIEVVPAYAEDSSYADFLNNISRTGLGDWVEPARKTSRAAAGNWNEPIRLLFVDGSHRYEDVLLDLRLWEPWVDVGGVICMHDTRASGHRKGVRRAMNEYIVAGGRFDRLLEMKNMTVFEKSRRAAKAC